MTESPAKIAVITGGASGMGLGVAQALAARGGWQIHIFDVKEDEGGKAAGSINGQFHKVDLTNYADLGAAFKGVFVTSGNRLDFVFANAGIIERASIFDVPDTLDPPPEPNFLPLDVNLKACINTIHIGRHYIGRSPEKGSIVATGSVASIYPSFFAPVYTASKFGVLGFVRTVAGSYKVNDGVRINALLPGNVRTSLIEDAVWDQFPPNAVTPMDLISKVVLGFVDGGEIVDAKNVRIAPEKNYGQAIVASGPNFYIIPEPEYCDELTASVMEHTRSGSESGLLNK